MRLQIVNRVKVWGFSGAFLLGSAVGATASDVVIEDFEQRSSGLSWQIVNDSVMGGVSTSRLRLAEAGIARFSGQLSLANNGGFASVRGSGRLTELSGANAMVLRVKGDGRTYQLRLRMGSSWRTPAYSASFTTKPGEWQTYYLMIEDFEAGWRGRSVREAPPLDPADISSIGIFLGDKNPGTFLLDIDWIKAAATEDV